MAELRFEFDWTDPLGARGDELRATWARLLILVHDEPVTRVLDERAKTVRDSIYVPLYPLAEWLATHWWALCHELETPERAGQPDYQSRHSLVTAREGYSLPPLHFQSSGELVCLAWTYEKLPHHGIEFISRGMACIRLKDFERTVADFLESVIARLRECGVEKTLLQSEWSAITDSSQEEQDYCRAAAALGFDPYELDDTSRDAIVELGEHVPTALRHEFFAAARLAELDTHVQQLADALQAITENQVDLVVIRRLRQKWFDTLPPVTAWGQGYAVAQTLRSLLQVGNQPLSSFGALSEAFQIDESDLKRAILDPASEMPFFDAIVGVNTVGSPGFVIGPRSKEARLFHFCRGLFEHIVDRNGAPSLVTRAASDRQRRNRAFAAEFLAPSAALRDMVRTPSVSMENVDELARHFGVSYYVIQHQLCNHQIANPSSD